MINKTLVLFSISFFLFFNCINKSSIENQIKIKINSIDNKTKKPRVNKFDNIEVRVTEFGFPTKKFVKIAEYTTDSTGSVVFNVDSEEEYRFLISGPNIYGSSSFTTAFTKDKLKDGQEVNIEVISLDNR